MAESERKPVMRPTKEEEYNMNIIVCVKQVPDTEEIQIDRENHILIREGVSSILNPYDGYALEVAAKIKDKNPDTKIVVVTMGPLQAEKVLRECLSIAADQAYLVTDKLFVGSDTYATSYILSQAIKYIEKIEDTQFQAIFCGKQAIDGDTAQVGPELAEHMGYPQVTSCLEAEEKEKELVVLQERLESKKIIGVTYPCVITFTKPDYDPRFPTFKRKIEARKAVIKHITAKDMEEIDLSNVGINGSPTKVKKSFVQVNKKEGVVIEAEDIEQTVQKLCDVIIPLCVREK